MAENIFDKASKHFKKKLRQEFADTLLEVGQADQRLVVLIGDISHFILQPFAQACPDRYYNVGICESATVNMASGIAKVGLIPVVHTIAPFIVERAFEQIKLDFGYQKLGVNLVTVGSAFDYGALGCTHHCYGDFALLKTIEQIEIIYPASCIEFNMLFKETYANGKPTYFRIPESQHEQELDPETIKLGKGIKLKSGEDVTLIATGPQLKTAMLAAESLEASAISAEVLYFPTIRPLDHQLVNNSLLKTKCCLVIEEHSMYGGIFDDILRCSSHLNVSYEAINLGDKFIRTYGSYQEHCIRLGFTVENITEKSIKLVEKKNIHSKDNFYNGQKEELVYSTEV